MKPLCIFKFLRNTAVSLTAILIVSACPDMFSQDKEYRTFSGNEDFAPFSFYSDGKPSGFVVDLAAEISKNLRDNILVSLLPDPTYVSELINGNVSGIIGLPVISELKKHLDYSIPVATLDCAIFVSQDNEYIRNLKTLEGTIVAMYRGSIYVDTIRQNHSKINIMLTDTVKEAFQKLKNGEVTAVICEKNIAVYNIHEHGMRGIKIVGEPIGPFYDYSLAVKRGDTELLNSINYTIGILEKNGTLDALRRKWFGLSLVDPFPWKRVATVIGVITGIMLFMLTGLWVVSLNAAIKIKTAHIHLLSRKMQEKDKLAVLGKLAGQIAHELRTPLSIISNSIFLLKREGTENRVLFEKRLSLLEDKVRLTSNILESILSYSRVKAEVASTICIVDCLKEVLKDIEKPPQVSVEMKTENSGKLQVFIDFHQMYSVLRNVIINSLQAMKKGGRLSILSYLDEEDNSVTIRIADTGTGLSGITPEKIFDLFSSTKITGTGLGLPISKSIVETNGGTLFLESTSKSGSVFVIKLPFAPDTKTGDRNG